MKRPFPFQRFLSLLALLTVPVAVFLATSVLMAPSIGAEAGSGQWLAAQPAAQAITPAPQDGVAACNSENPEDCPPCITPTLPVPPPPSATPTPTQSGCPGCPPPPPTPTPTPTPGCPGCPTETPPAPPPTPTPTTGCPGCATPTIPPPPSQLYDLGDAPDWLGQTTLPHGARHLVTNMLRLGQCVDAETSVQAAAVDAPAINDDLAQGLLTFGLCDPNTPNDDEDGADPDPATFALNGAASIPVTVNGVSAPGACVYGWIDWSRDGFGNGGDSVSGPTYFATSATQTMVFPPAPYGNPPENVYYIRLRLAPATSSGCTNPGPTALVSGGEVEDYDIYFVPPPALAVNVMSFGAASQSDHILVTWETSSEIDHLGFNLLRGASASEPDTQLNSALIPSQAPGSPTGFAYSWQDRLALESGTTYYYWLEIVGMDGSVVRDGPISATFEAPMVVTLSDLQANSARQPLPVWLWAVGAVAVCGAGGLMSRKKAKLQRARANHTS